MDQFEKDLFFTAVSAGVGAATEAAKFGYNYLTDPQNRENTAQNARQFAQNFGRYRTNGQDWFFQFDKPKLLQAQEEQYRQLEQTRALRSQGVQTGFDDEQDNINDERIRARQMTPTRTNQSRTTPAVINSNRPSDYAPNQRFQADLYNYQLQNQSRNYATNVNANVMRQNNQLQSQDRRQANQLNAQNQRYGIDVNAGVNRELGYAKTYADLQAAMNRNQLQSGDNRFETTTKYGTQERINQFNRNTIDRTEVAKAQIQAGTYGRSQSDINSMQIESNARKVNNEYNDRMMQYGRYQMEIANFQNNIANANRSYSDQRFDRRQDRADAMARFNREQAQKEADRAEYYRQQNLDRQLKRDDFALRSQQIQNQIAQTNQEFALRQQEFALRSAESAAKVNQIYSDTRLKNDQFGATRSDIGYNRLQQRRSMAF